MRYPKNNVTVEAAVASAANKSEMTRIVSDRGIGGIWHT